MRHLRIHYFTACVAACLCAALASAQSAPALSAGRESLAPASGPAGAAGSTVDPTLDVWLTAPASGPASAAASAPGSAPASRTASAPASGPATATQGAKEAEPPPPLAPATSPAPVPPPTSTRFADWTPTTLPARPKPVSEADRLAARSLYLAADSLVYDPADTPARAGRILALAQMAERLDGGDPDINYLLAGIYKAQDNYEALARCLEVCHAAYPGDHLLGVRLLKLSLDVLDTAGARLAHLQAFARRDGLPLPLRAEALAEMGKIYRGQGRPAEARAAFEEALRLDAAQPEAAGGLVALTKAPSTADRLRAALAMVRGSPRSADLALQAGTLLEEVGLYTQARVFFEHAWEMSQSAGDRQLQGMVLPRYCNAMLAAKEYPLAVSTFAPLLANYPSPDLYGLLIEAYQAPGVDDPMKANRAKIAMLNNLTERQEAARRQAAQELERKVDRLRAAGVKVDPNAVAKDRQTLQDGADAESAREMAWYYEQTVREPNLALFYAERAATDSNDDPLVQRLLGIAELRTGRVEEGIQRLKPLAKTDGFAALFLADYYYGNRDPNFFRKGREVVLDGVSAGRSGPAYRRLKELADNKMITIPPPADANECLALYNGFNAESRQFLEMARKPEKFISVSVTPVRDAVAAGMPVEVSAVLKNTSAIDVPLGEWGLVAPRIGFGVNVPGVKEPFSRLPVASWPAPRYLAAGAAVAVRARLDVGTLEDFLAQRPLEDIVVGVASTLDPLQRGNRVAGLLSGVTVPFASVRRQALVDVAEANDPQKLAQAAGVLLQHVVYDLKNGDLPARMLAARRTASLLALQRRGDLGKAALPKPVAAALSRPVLLRIVVEALKDPSDVIRAEMIAALGAVALDDGMVSLLAPLVGDVSPLVRMRLAELLGASGLRGQTTILDHFAKDDPDEMVRKMASAFLSPPKKN